MTVRKGKIGVFDSGLGGLTILRAIAELMPEREYLYLGDNLHTPYGNRMPEEIFQLTLRGVEWLFGRGAEVVVLACNTASANALRRIQREILPLKYPDRRVLGIIIPTVEELEKWSETGHVGILATRATVASKTFEVEMAKRNPEIAVFCRSGGDLAELIEKNVDAKILLAEIGRTAGRLVAEDERIDTFLLGCTHYALIEKEIADFLGKKIKVVTQGRLVALKLQDYLKRHPEMEKRLSRKAKISFYTTSPDDRVKKLMIRFYGQKISIEVVKIDDDK